MKKVNYKSSDGNFYRLETGRRSEAKESDRDSMIYLNDDEVVRFIKVDNADDANPVVQLRDDASRCPWCWERKCIESGKIKGQGSVTGIMPGLLVYVQKKEVSIKVLKQVCRCITPKHAHTGKLFVTEVSMDVRPTTMLKKEHCLTCNAGKENLTVRVTKDYMDEQDSLRRIPQVKYDLHCAKCNRGLEGVCLYYTKSYASKCPNMACNSIRIKKKEFGNITDEQSKTTFNIYSCEDCGEMFFVKNI